MAHIRQRSTVTWEITIRRKNLPKPIHASADTEVEAKVWAERMEAQLDSGFIPTEILTDIQRSQKTISKWLDEYADEVAISPSDSHRTRRRGLAVSAERKLTLLDIEMKARIQT